MVVKAALIIFRNTNSQRELMFVKAKNKNYYVFPGGKQEKDEGLEQALKRELLEELQCEAKGIKKLGEVEGKTPDGRNLTMHLYSASLDGVPTPSAEIEEILWLGRQQIEVSKSQMTPMTLNHVLPFLSDKGLW